MTTSLESFFDDEDVIETYDTEQPEEKHDWTAEWTGMPEFVQEKQTPFSTITIRFATEEHLNEFSALIGQKLTPKTKSIWHPQLVRGLNVSKKYTDAA